MTTIPRKSTEERGAPLSPFWYALAGVNILAPCLAVVQIMPWHVFGMLSLLVAAGLAIAPRLLHVTATMRIAIGILLCALIFWVSPPPSLQAGVGWATIMELDVLYVLEWITRVLIILSAGRALLLVSSRDLAATPLAGLWVVILGSIVVARDAQWPLSVGIAVFLISSLLIISHAHCRAWVQLPTRAHLGTLTVWIALLAIGLLGIAWLPAFQLSSLNLATMMRQERHFNTRWQWSVMPPRHVVLGAEPTLTLGNGQWPRGSTPMMTIRVSGNAPADLRWRGHAYDSYQDGAWQRSALLAAPESEGWSHQLFGAEFFLIRLNPYGVCGDAGFAQLAADPGFPHASNAHHFSQFIIPEVTAQRGEVPLYGAFQITEAVSNDPLFADVQVRRDGSISLSSPSQGMPLAPYEVTSLVKPPPSQFRLATPLALAPDEQERYLQLPGGNSVLDGQTDGALATKLRPLARQMLAEAGQDNSPYARATRLELYLSTHYRYTLAPEPAPDGVDPLLDFLSTQRQGYCVYFAGALALLCRAEGIPARVVVGFGSGEPVQSLAGEVTYHVTAGDAHAWTEVFLPQYGWHALDPTAGSLPAPAWWQSSWRDLLASLRQQGRQWRAALPTLALWFGICLAILLLLRRAMGWHRRRPLLPTSDEHALTPAEARATVIRAYMSMQGQLARWGIPKPVGATAHEFDTAITALHPALGEISHQLALLYLQAQYSPHGIGDADARTAVTLLRQLDDLGYRERMWQSLSRKRNYA